MTDISGGAGDDPTRVDRDPPSFPSVSDSKPAQAGSGAALFSAAADPTSTSAPSAQTSPIATTSTAGSKRGGGSLRWLVAGIATLIVVAMIGGVLVLAAPRAGAPSATAHYVPASTAMYAEVRLDLPGDQHDNLAAFMSHFPGFADQAAFQQKLDESLNSVLTSRSNGALDWNNDVKPWFGGQMAIFGSFNPQQMATDGTSLSNAMASMPDSVLVLTVSDQAKLQAVIDAHTGSAQVASTDYQGRQIKTVAQPAGTSVSASYVITDDALLIAPTVDLLKQALDVKAGTQPALADDSYFLAQLGALHADRLATVYFDPSKQVAAMPMPSDLPLPAQCTQLYQGASTKYVGEVRAESDHLAFTVRSQIPSGDNAPPAPTNKHTTLAQSMPADTLYYLEARNAGDTAGYLLKNLLTCTTSGQPGGPLPSGLGGISQFGDPSQIFEQFLGAKPEDYLNFVDDAAVGLTYTNDKLGGGIVATVDDQATAQQRIAKLLSLIKLLGGGAGGPTGGAQITTDQADHNGTEVTTIQITSPPARCPTNVGCPAGIQMTLQVAVANNQLYLGLDDFVTAALDRTAADSLASNASYQKAISGGPSDNSGIIYVDAAAAADLYREKLPPDKQQDFDANVKPFVDHFSTFSIVGHVDGGTLVNNGFLYVE